MGWSVRDYLAGLQEKGKRCSGLQEKVEESLRQMFPPGKTEKMCRPGVIVDSEGVILVWFLPGLLCSRRQVRKSDLVEYGCAD